MVMLLFSPKRKGSYHGNRDEDKNSYSKVPEMTSFLLNSHVFNA